MASTRRLTLALLLLALAVPAAARDARAGDPALAALQHLLAPTLMANRRGFDGVTGRVEGFGAGDAYPQIWLRDSASLVPFARYLVPREVLASWLEEHLAHQQSDGSLYDWIAAGEAARFREWAPGARDVFRSGAVALSADKNTTEADQETSAVDGAYQVWRATGELAWLRKPIAGRPLLARLSDAVRFLLERRFDKRLGLVTSAFTADWGDVSPIYPDQRAIYLDARTPMVAGLYTNALAVRACSELSEMHAAAGDGVRAAYFRTRSASLRAAMNRQLWREELGFYQAHVVLTPDLVPARARGDEALFALGGNALAVLAGVASDAQARRIFDAAEQRRREHRIATIASVLLPPYPKDAFLHPAMADAWQYQNGGQWDWFAGRFVLAEFERGFSRRATEHLLALARRAVAAGGCYEWYTRAGAGKGSPRYAGSAAALASALYEGLYGIELAGGRLDLDVRLRSSTAAVELREPATGTSVAYRYRADGLKLTLELETSARVGRIRMALPDGTRASSVRRAAGGVAFTLEERGEDRYVVVPGAGSPDRLELRLLASR